MDSITFTQTKQFFILSKYSATARRNKLFPTKSDPLRAGGMRPYIDFDSIQYQVKTWPVLLIPIFIILCLKYHQTSDL